jgi:hypothetical protein
MSDFLRLRLVQMIKSHVAYPQVPILQEARNGKSLPPLAMQLTTMAKWATPTRGEQAQLATTPILSALDTPGFPQ